MAEVSKSRLALNLEDIERQLRHSSQQPGSFKSDPLAELARIVGQDDPYRALLAAERAALNGSGHGDDIFARADPVLDTPLHGQDGLAADEHSHPMALTPEEEAILYGRRAPRYTPDPDDASLYHGDDAASGIPDGAFAPVEPRRSRKKGLIAAAAVLAAVAVGVTGVMTLRPSDPSSPAGGEPPVVKADAGPAKVVPQNPGGMEFPNQNTQVYERGVPDSQTRVVDREEQPVDVRQAARTAMVPSAPNTAAPALQGLNSSAANILGEPRRVRTVSIRPDDGTIVPPQQDAAGRSTPPVTPPLPTAPQASPAGPPVMSSLGPTAYSQAPAQQRPRDVAAAPAARVSGPGPLQITPEASRTSPEPRVAAAPQAVLREPAETSAAPGAGGFTVQLGYRSTEREARSLFEKMQQRFPNDLGGFSPLLLEAEINGKPAYRVRVGPLSREDATSLCNRLKSSGGPCYVASN